MGRDRGGRLLGLLLYYRERFAVVTGRAGHGVSGRWVGLMEFG